MSGLPKLKPGYPDYVDDPDGLARFREQVRHGRGHDMAICNNNSLGRLIDTIERLRAERDTALTTPSQRLDAAMVERCAALVDQSKLFAELRGIEVGDEEKAASFGRILIALAKDMRALATEPHQHGGKGA